MDQSHKLVPFPLDAFWQPCRPERQYEGRVGSFVATASRFVVVTSIESAPELGELRNHGSWWNREDAVRYARTCQSDARVEEVPVYWYAAAWGRVD
jgi:hypothetical protein